MARREKSTETQIMGCLWLRKIFFFIWFFSCCLYGIEKLKVLLWRITIPDMAQFTTLSMLSEDVWWRWQSVMEHTNYVMYKLPSNLLRTLCEKINAITLGIYCGGHSRWNASCIPIFYPLQFSRRSSSLWVCGASLQIVKSFQCKNLPPQRS